MIAMSCSFPYVSVFGSKQYTLIWFARAGICGPSHLLIARKPFTGTMRWGVTISTRAEENVLLIRQTGGL